MILNKKKNIEDTEWGQAIYVSSDTIKDDMLFIIKNNIKGVIISNDNGYLLDNVDFFKEYNFIEIVIISAYKEVDYAGIQYLKNLKVLALNILSKDKFSGLRVKELSDIRILDMYYWFRKSRIK